MINKKTDKQALLDWDEFLLSIRNSTPVDLSESDEEKAARIKRLEKPGNHEEWFKYYFPKYATCEPAAFHKKSSAKFLKSPKIYHSRKWARGLSKTTRRMFEVLYRMLVQKRTKNMLLISHSYDNAERLLDSYQVNLEANQRIINDYGVQERPGKWKHGEFTTRSNCTFRAVGGGQNPRGTKNEELRVDTIVFDDIDDDEMCRNPERVEERWKWIEGAVIPTVDIAADFCICFDNNVIAEDSITLRAAKYATYSELVNIRDENNVSVWPEKNSEAAIDYMISIMSYEASQKEYFNNPLTSGNTFEEMVWGKCPPLKSLRFVVTYADPATSNKDKPTAKSKAHSSCKCVAIIGYHDGKFYVYKCFLDNTTNSNFIDWFYAAKHYIGDKTQGFYYVENNSLQDPFYEQVLLPLIYAKGKDNNGVLPITPDTRDKPEKWFRVEGTLEPLNRLGLLILNIEEKDNPHMKRLEAQFKAAKATSKTLDGPDCIEGGVFKIKEKTAVESTNGIECIKRPKNLKRY